MLKNYIITAINNLWHSKLFSAINIIGLSVALVGIIFIALYVRNEIAYDRWLPDSERIVRLHTSYSELVSLQSVRSAGRMMEALRDSAPTLVEKGVRLIPFSIDFKLKEKTIREEVIFADGSFFDIFQLPFLYGSAQSSFNSPMDLVLSRSMAEKYFGRTDVVGESLTMCCGGRTTGALRVTGVLEDIPELSHFDVDFLIRVQPSFFGSNDSILNTWTSLNVYTYFKLADTSSMKEFQRRIEEWLADDNSPIANSLRGQLPEGLDVENIVHPRLMRVPDIHLQAKDGAGNLGDFKPLGDYRTVMIFTAAAVLLLLIAVFNFVNLTTAHASHRAREISLRKVMGARRGQLSRQFLGESVTVSLIASFFALVLVELLMPVFNTLLGFSYDLDFADQGLFIAGLFFIVILIGLFAGAYPAFYMSRFKPVTALKAGRSQTGDGQEGVRSLLVVFQFIVFVVLGACTLVIFAQIYYARHFDVGYRYDNKLVLNSIGTGNVRNKLSALMQEVTTIPGVDSMVFSNDVPSRDNENNAGFRLLGTGNSEGVDAALAYYAVSEGFFAAYDVELVAGRHFGASGNSVTFATEPAGQERAPVVAAINETALKAFGFSSAREALGRTLAFKGQGYEEDEMEIVAVVRDIYYSSLKSGVKPSVYFNNPSFYRVATITYNTADVPVLIGDIEVAWNRVVAQAPFDVASLAEMVSAQYQPEDQQVRLLSVFSLLSISVACLGLYGLSSFTVNRKKREIALRKLHGGQIYHILVLLLRKFSLSVIIGNVIAWPLAAWWVFTWLENFNVRLNSGWILLIGLIVSFFSLLLMWVTVIANTYSTVRQRPVHALRYE